MIKDRRPESVLRNRSNLRPVFDSPFAFKCLIFLTFIMFVAPMNFLPFLMPFRLALVSAVLAIGAYLVSTVRARRPLSVMGSEVKIVLALFGFAIISVPGSKWPGGSYEYLNDTLLRSVIVFFLIANLLSSEARCRQFLWGLTLFTGFNAILGIYQFKTGAFMRGAGNRIIGGYSGLTANPNDLALAINLLIPFILYLYATSKSFAQRCIAGTVLGLGIICVVITFSRSGAVTLLGLVLWYLWTMQSKRRFKSVLAIAGLIMVVAMLVPSGYGSRLATSVNIEEDETGSANARLELLKAGLRNSVAHPFGVGLAMNNLLQKEEGLGWSPVHNAYLQVSTELGIIAAILYIVLLWKMMRSIQKVVAVALMSGNDHLAAIAKATEGGLIAFAIGAMFAPVAYNFYLYIVVGVGMAIKELARTYPGVTDYRNLQLYKTGRALPA